LLAVIDLLTEATIETRVLKGAAVAHLDYSRPAQRSFIDLDILARGEHFDRAEQTLITASSALFRSLGRASTGGSIRGRRSSPQRDMSWTCTGPLCWGRGVCW
jgi:hypothetical protein